MNRVGKNFSKLTIHPQIWNLQLIARSTICADWETESLENKLVVIRYMDLRKNQI